MAAFLGSMGTDWLLKRAFKFMLKRNLGSLLRNEVDLDMLNVSLGTGTLEIRSALLNTDYLDAQLGSPYWEIAAGYVGALKAEIPFTNLYSQAVSLTLDEALLTLRPRSKPRSTPTPTAADSGDVSGSQGPDPGKQVFGEEGAAGWDDYGFGQATVADGVKLIAGGLENVLQRFRLQARNITLRIELPPLEGEGGPPALVIVRLEDLTYAGEATSELAAPMPAAMRLQKMVTFAGLTVELFEDVQEAPAAEEPDVSAFSQILTPAVAEPEQHRVSLPEPQAELKNVDATPTGSPESQTDGAEKHTCTEDVLDYRESMQGSWTDIGSEEPSTPVGQQMSTQTFASPSPSSQALSPQPFVSSPFAQHTQSSFADDDVLSEGSVEGDSEEQGDSSHVIICSATGVGCSGRLRLLLTWRAQSQLHPDIEADLNLDPLQVQLHPHHLPLLLHLTSCLGEAAAASALAAAAAAREASVAAADAPAAEPAPAARSIIEGMLLPDTTAFATEFISQSWGYGRASAHASDSQALQESGGPDEFFDALASIRSSVSSFVTTTAASLRASEGGDASSFASTRSGAPETPSGRSGSLAATSSLTRPPGHTHSVDSQRGAQLGPARASEEAPVLESLGWQLHVTAGDLSLVLRYPEDAPGCSVQVDAALGASCDYRARFSMECCDLDLSLAAGPDGRVDGKLRLWRLEAVEHIPAAAGTAAAMVTALEEVIRVPEVLPAAVGGARPVPSFAGVSVLPLKRSLYSSTLSQLSALSASFGAVTAAQPQVQIWPVIAVAGGHAADGGTPSVSLELTAPATPGTGPASAAVAVALRAVSVWLSLPFLQRMEAFLSLLLLHQQQLAAAAAAAEAQARAAGTGMPIRGGGDNRYHAETALDAILDDLQEFQAGGQGPLAGIGREGSTRMACAVPRVCAVLLLPPPPNSPHAPVCHGYSYVALELSNVPSIEGEAQVPMFEVRNGGDAVWEAEAKIGRAKAYLVGSPYATDFGFSNVLQGPLQANCVVDIVASPDQQQVAVTADVRWTGGVPCQPHLIDGTWARVRAHATEASGSKGAGLETVHFQEAAIASSPLRIRLQAPEVLADIARADLAALLQLADAVIRWRADAAALAAATAGEVLAVPAAQTAILVEAGVKCNLQHVTQGLEVDMARRSAAAFLVDVEELRAFAVTGLGGSVEALAAALTAAGATLTGGAAQDCLLHVPSSAAATRSRPAPRLELVCVQRPATGDGVAACAHTIAGAGGEGTPSAGPRGPPPLEAAASLAARGATFSAASGDLTLPWLGHLGDFLSVGSACDASGAPPPAPPMLDLDVHMQDCALRYEPPEMIAEDVAPPVAAALLVGGLHTHICPPDPSLTLELRSLSVFCAEAAARGHRWAAAAPADVPGAHLLRSGYHLIAAEPLLRVALRPPASDDGTFEVEVSNEQLHSALTAPAFRLVTALGAQVAATFSDEPEAPATAAVGRRAGVQRSSAAGASSSGGSAGGMASSAAAPPVRVLENVQEDAYRPQGARAQAAAASVFLEGGWLNPELGDAFERGADLAITFPEAQLGPSQHTPLSGEGRGRDLARGAATLARFSGEAPPVYDDHFDQPRGSSSERGSPATEEMGHWFQDGPDGAPMGPPEIVPDHVPVPPPGPPGGFSGIGGFGRGAIGPLPPAYPPPAARLVLRDLRLLLQLCCSPGDDDGDPMQPSAQPRLELEVEGLCAQAEAFPPGGAHVRRGALSVRHAELRDCAPRPEGGAAWQRILAYHATSHVPRDAQACLFQVELEAVRPGGGEGAEELRLGAAVLPLRLRIDQAVVEFLQVFFAPPNPDEGDGELINWADEDDTALGDAEGPDCLAEDDAGGEVFFQRAELWGFSVMVDYWPRRLDLAALKAGNLAEVLNIAPWGNVLLQLPPLRLSGAHGWAALGAALGDHWLKDITTHQAHKFLTGYAPIRSLVRVGTAAGALLAIPAEQLRREGGSGPRPPGGAPLSRKLQRSLTGARTPRQDPPLSAEEPLVCPAASEAQAEPRIALVMQLQRAGAGNSGGDAGPERECSGQRSGGAHWRVRLRHRPASGRLRGPQGGCGAAAARLQRRGRSSEGAAAALRLHHRRRAACPPCSPPGSCGAPVWRGSGRAGSTARSQECARPREIRGAPPVAMICKAPV